MASNPSNSLSSQFTALISYLLLDIRIGLDALSCANDLKKDSQASPEVYRILNKPEATWYELRTALQVRKIVSLGYTPTIKDAIACCQVFSVEGGPEWLAYACTAGGWQIVEILTYLGRLKLGLTAADRAAAKMTPQESGRDQRLNGGAQSPAAPRSRHSAVPIPPSLDYSQSRYNNNPDRTDQAVRRTASPKHASRGVPAIDFRSPSPPQVGMRATYLSGMQLENVRPTADSAQHQSRSRVSPTLVPHRLHAQAPSAIAPEPSRSTLSATYAENTTSQAKEPTARMEQIKTYSNRPGHQHEHRTLPSISNLIGGRPLRQSDQSSYGRPRAFLKGASTGLKPTGPSIRPFALQSRPFQQGQASETSQNRKVFALPKSEPMKHYSLSTTRTVTPCVRHPWPLAPSPSRISAPTLASGSKVTAIKPRASPNAENKEKDVPTSVSATALPSKASVIGPGLAKPKFALPVPLPETFESSRVMGGKAASFAARMRILAQEPNSKASTAPSSPMMEKTIPNQKKRMRSSNAEDVKMEKRRKENCPAPEASHVQEKAHIETLQDLWSLSSSLLNEEGVKSPPKSLLHESTTGNKLGAISAVGFAPPRPPTDSSSSLPKGMLALETSFVGFDAPLPLIKNRKTFRDSS
ncbi:uncharacterized protein JCM15063_002647 [Sporobolomyces koalae]|uniref:uncharacterized protein n=1 Tax=Sporobolomyces koalae TaxID=500713 RepID=UPI00317AE90F